MSIAAPIYKRPRRDECTFTHDSLEFGEWRRCRIKWDATEARFSHIEWLLQVEWFGDALPSDLEAQAFRKLCVMVDREARAQEHGSP